MRQRALVLSAVVVASVVNVRTLSAQRSNFGLVDGPEAVPRTGWIFTPSLAFQGAYDDNALLLYEPEPPRDFLTTLNPRADVTFLGRRGEFDANYDGAFLMYHDLNTLNSYDQRMSVSARRALTKQVTISARNAFADVPTTELVNFVAVPFVRTGSKLEDFRTGVDVALTKHTTLSGGYSFQWAEFDQPTTLPAFALHGGNSHGASANLKHELSDLTALTASYNFQHAYVVDGSKFDIVNADAGLDRQLLPTTRVFGAFGFSRLGVSQNFAARVGPSYRAGIIHHVRQTSITASYSRSFVPAFGFGGTFQNEEFLSQVHTPLARRVYTNSAVSWRRNEPLEPNGLRLKSFWWETSVGYAVEQWVRVEGFFQFEHQVIDRPGGSLGRKRMGFQVVTSKPMRIR
jgi:hypothetical protein